MLKQSCVKSQSSPVSSTTGGRPKREASRAAEERIASWARSGGSFKAASEEQLAEGVCAICLDPLFVRLRTKRATFHCGKVAKHQHRYRRNVCKLAVELVSCQHAFHNTCLLAAARAREQGAVGGVWEGPLCREVQPPIGDSQEYWQVLSAPEF
mmetsp:Transcript_16965/g.30312  ORF Transcript_16965/g.30312 Transcript_16965/m.30312 type:complete len:154 (-) Transcript_16965:200-661(-)